MRKSSVNDIYTYDMNSNLKIFDFPVHDARWCLTLCCKSNTTLYSFQIKFLNVSSWKVSLTESIDKEINKTERIIFVLKNYFVVNRNVDEMLKTIDSENSSEKRNSQSQ